MPQHFSHARTGARSHHTFGSFFARSIQTSLIAHLRIRADIGTSEVEVVEDGRRYDGNKRVSGLEPDPILFEEAHHPRRRIQPKSGPARQQDRIDLLHHHAWLQQVGLARAWRAAAHIHTGDGSLAAQYHSTAGQRLFILCVPNFNAGHIGNGIS